MEKSFGAQHATRAPVYGAKWGVLLLGYPVFDFKEAILLSVVLYANAFAVAFPKFARNLAPASVTVSYFRRKIRALDETAPCSAKRLLFGL